MWELGDELLVEHVEHLFRFVVFLLRLKYDGKPNQIRRTEKGEVLDALWVALSGRRWVSE